MNSIQSDSEYEQAVNAHIASVRDNILKLIKELYGRADAHDASKLQSPEREVFREHQSKLKDVEFASPEYKALLDSVRPAIQNHYAKNRHHPEFFKNGIDDMDLVDIIELLCDWIAAIKRNKNGNILKSLEINSQRFNISPQLKQILLNTINRYF